MFVTWFQRVRVVRWKIKILRQKFKIVRWYIWLYKYFNQNHEKKSKYGKKVKILRNILAKFGCFETFWVEDAVRFWNLCRIRDTRTCCFFLFVNHCKSSGLTQILSNGEDGVSEWRICFSVRPLRIFPGWSESLELVCSSELSSSSRVEQRVWQRQSVFRHCSYLLVLFSLRYKDVLCLSCHISWIHSDSSSSSLSLSRQSETAPSLLASSLPARHQRLLTHVCSRFNLDCEDCEDCQPVSAPPLKSTVRETLLQTLREREREEVSESEVFSFLNTLDDAR